MDQFIQTMFELPGVFWAGVGIQLGLIFLAFMFLAPPRLFVPIESKKRKLGSTIIGIAFVAAAFSWSFILGSATVIFERHNLL